MRRLVLLACMFLLKALPLHAQQAPVTARDTIFLDSVLRAHRFPIAVTNGVLAGDGAAFLRDATNNVQFFVLGESHYVAQIPEFAMAMFGALHDSHGFNYYAVEYGPVIASMVSRMGIRGRQDLIFSLARRYPHAFQFWDDEEVQAFARIGATSTARSLPIWGVDQEWGALHVLDRLAAIAPTPAARALVDSLAQLARSVESHRAFEIVDVVDRFITIGDSTPFPSA